MSEVKFCRFLLILILDVKYFFVNILPLIVVSFQTALAFCFFYLGFLLFTLRHVEEKKDDYEKVEVIINTLLKNPEELSLK